MITFQAKSSYNNIIALRLATSDNFGDVFPLRDGDFLSLAKAFFYKF